MNAAYIKIGLGGADIGSSYFLPAPRGRKPCRRAAADGSLHPCRSCAVTLGLLSDDRARRGSARRPASRLLRKWSPTRPYGLALTKQALNLNIDAPSIDAAFALEDRQQVMLSDVRRLIARR